VYLIGNLEKKLLTFSTQQPLDFYKESARNPGHVIQCISCPGRTARADERRHGRKGNEKLRYHISKARRPGQVFPGKGAHDGLLRQGYCKQCGYFSKPLIRT
jgi:hypothetical protein